jgi:diamine N-acetyltransferase
MLSFCKADPQLSEQKNAYCIWRIMIDKQFQGKGYGRTAVKLAIELAESGFAGQADTIVLFVEPANHIAVQLYESFGFTKTNEVIDGQIKYERSL